MEFVSCQESLVNLLMIRSIHCTLRFMNKHGDSELDSMLLNTVPPCDITRVALFNAALNKWEKEACLPWTVSLKLFFNKVWHMTCHEYILRNSHHLSQCNLGGSRSMPNKPRRMKSHLEFYWVNNQPNMYHKTLLNHNSQTLPKKTWL